MRTATATPPVTCTATMKVNHCWLVSWGYRV